MRKHSYDIRKIAVDGLLTAILFILGMIKIPSFLPGAEFQLSAGYAVCICYMVGFYRYLGIGICSSLLQLALGTHTIWNVLIAMVFRIVAGMIVTGFRKYRLSVYLAGPIGTMAGRIVLAAILKVPVWPLLAAAAPGMIFTVVMVAVLLPICKGFKKEGLQNVKRNV